MWEYVQIRSLKDVLKEVYDGLAILTAIHLVCSVVEEIPNTMGKALGRLIGGE